MSISFANVAPQCFNVYQPESTVQGISRKQQVEFLADSQNSFQFGSASEIRINVQSNTDILIGAESFITMDVTFTRTSGGPTLNAFTAALAAAGAAGGAADTQSSNGIRLEMGGVHSLFSKIEVKSLATNTTLQLCELYNKYYVIKSRFFRTPSSGRMNEDGDGFENEDRLWSVAGQPLEIFKARVKNSNIIGLSQTVSANNNNSMLIGNNSIGTVPAFTAPHFNIVNDPALDVVLDYGFGANLAAGAGVISRSGTNASLTTSKQSGYDANDSAIQSVQYKMRFTPLLSLLLSDIPLLLMKNGIQIILTLANPTDALYVNPAGIRYSGIVNPSVAMDATVDSGKIFNAITGAAATSLFYVGIQIDNPRYVAQLVTPTEEYTAQLVSQYRSPSGIFLNTPNYRTLRLGALSNSQSQNFLMNPGVRSLRNVWAGFYSTTYQTSTSNDAGANFFYRMMNHSHVPMYISTQYAYWNIGATKWPNRDAYIYNLASLKSGVQAPTLVSELNALYDRVMGDFHITDCEIYHYIRAPLHFRTPEYDSMYAVIGAVNIPFPALPTFYPGYYVQAFSRDNGRGSELTGIDVSVTPLECHMLLNAVNTITPPLTPISTAADPRFDNCPFYNQQMLWSSGNLEFITFAEHDQFVNISSQGVVVLN